MECVGGTSPGDDNAQLVSATWREMRQSVLRNGMVQFDFQQFLFACQARILLKLNRPAEVCPTPGPSHPDWIYT